MARGAAPGERRGGRAKGTRNKKTEERFKEMGDTGEMPLHFLLCATCARARNSTFNSTAPRQQLRIATHA